MNPRYPVEVPPRISPMAFRRVLPLSVCLGLVLVAPLTGCGGGGGSSQSEPTPETGTITGTVQATADSVTDGDTNDPSIPLVRNDSIENAQVIGNPSTVGGYAAERGTGPEGALNLPDPSIDLDDTSDIFRIRMVAGQALTLTIGDNNTGDLDLYLATLDGTLIDGSEGVGRQEFVVVPSDGEYLVQVFAFRGYSNYILETNQDTSATAGIETFRYGADFVPGQLIVAFNEESDDDNSARPKPLLAMEGYESRSLIPGAESLYRIPEAIQSKHALYRGAARKLRPTTEDARLRTLSAAKNLAGISGVRSVSLNHIHKPFAVPTDPLAVDQWHYDLINLPAALDLSTGSGVTVAVIDTGMITTHPDFNGQLDPSDPNGVDFISNASFAGDFDGVDDDGFDVGDRLSPSGTSTFHGTHVAGTIAAATNNGIGGAGVAPDARLLNLRVLGSQGATSYDILQAVRYAAGLANDFAPASAPRASIINMSLGGPSFSSIEQNVYSQVRAAGVLVIAAAGNDDASFLNYPASYAGVVSVSAVGPTRARAYYSQFNAAVDVAAPGGDMRFRSRDGVLSTSGDDTSGLPTPTYRYQQGTSMAAPHVAGIAALMKSAYPAMTPAQFDQLLQSGTITQDLGNAGRDNVFGHGLIDARRAVVAALQLAGQTPADAPPVPASTPSTLELRASQTTADFAISNNGGGTLTVSAVGSDVPWVAVQTVISNSQFRVSVNRNGIADGVYPVTISIQTNAGTLSIPLRVEVFSGRALQDIGTLYVLAIDAATLETVGQAEVRPDSGSYAFSLPNLPAGDYLIGAGSDLNNDGFVCDPGESCGAFPSLDGFAPVTVSAGQTINSVDFVAGYVPVISADASSAPESPVERRGYERLR